MSDPEDGGRPGAWPQDPATGVKGASTETYKVPTTIYWGGSNCGVRRPQHGPAVRAALICFIPFDTAS